MTEYNVLKHFSDQRFSPATRAPAHCRGALCSFHKAMVSKQFSFSNSRQALMAVSEDLELWSAGGAVIGGSGEEQH